MHSYDIHAGQAEAILQKKVSSQKRETEYHGTGARLAYENQTV